MEDWRHRPLTPSCGFPKGKRKKWAGENASPDFQRRANFSCSRRVGISHNDTTTSNGLHSTGFCQIKMAMSGMSATTIRYQEWTSVRTRPSHERAPRPPQARRPAGPLYDLEIQPRLADISSTRHIDIQSIGGLPAEAVRTLRLPRGDHANDIQKSAVGEIRPPGKLWRGYVLGDGVQIT